MRWAIAGLGTVLAGIMTFMGIYYVLDGTIVNEENYHGLKEAMEGAMYDSVDIDYYQKTGEIKIIKEKFVETFSRRFTETTTYGKKGYTIEFYDIIESPPKASIIIKGHSGDFRLTLDSNDLSSYDISNKLDGILLYKTKHLYTYDLYSFTNTEIYNYHSQKLVGIYSSNMQVPEELRKVYNIGPSQTEQNNQHICKIVNIEYVEEVNKSNAQKAAQEFTKEVNSKKSYQKWYFAPHMVTNINNIIAINKLATGNTEDFCEIETIQCFEYTKGSTAAKCAINSCGPNDCLRDISVTFKNEGCMNSANKITGFKYRVTWECSQ